MKTRLESRFDFKIVYWLLPIAPFILVPLYLFFKKLKEGYYGWESLSYYFILPVFVGIGLWVAIKNLLELSPKVFIYPDHLTIAGTEISFDQISKRLFKY